MVKRETYIKFSLFLSVGVIFRLLIMMGELWDILLRLKEDRIFLNTWDMKRSLIIEQKIDMEIVH